MFCLLKCERGYSDYGAIDNKLINQIRTPMRYKSAEEFHNHLLEAIEKKRSYHLEKFETEKTGEDQGAVDALAWVYTIIKLGKGNIEG